MLCPRLEGIRGARQAFVAHVAPCPWNAPDEDGSPTAGSDAGVPSPTLDRRPNPAPQTAVALAGLPGRPLRRGTNGHQYQKVSFCWRRSRGRRHHASRSTTGEGVMAIKVERFQPEGMNVRMSAGQPSYSHVVTVSGP